ncbi:hypothetical protein SAMN05421858_4086 [Haladaptatus litoreus]|uniref:Cox cluster protein n=1 Tax=Haladaptatus litoreus TaxID=553468 RepID=A0A1N7E770_9EURY|nr:DUF6684 family protein [Haladaptatus litoreus]SIR83992.1 hypothetical protein SAMN05421858_4086 [Haladaptatus litoreus]
MAETEANPESESDVVFDRETLLDISVNIVPMVILLFFIVLFVVWTPWSGEPLISAMSHLLTIIPFVLLGLLTWIAAHYVR